MLKAAVATLALSAHVTQAEWLAQPPTDVSYTVSSNEEGLGLSDCVNVKAAYQEADCGCKDGERRSLEEKEATMVALPQTPVRPYISPAMSSPSNIVDTVAAAGTSWGFWMMYTGANMNAEMHVFNGGMPKYPDMMIVVMRRMGVGPQQEVFHVQGDRYHLDTFRDSQQPPKLPSLSELASATTAASKYTGQMHQQEYNGRIYTYPIKNKPLGRSSLPEVLGTGVSIIPDASVVDPLWNPHLIEYDPETSYIFHAGKLLLHCAGAGKGEGRFMIGFCEQMYLAEIKDDSYNVLGYRQANAPMERFTQWPLNYVKSENGMYHMNATMFGKNAASVKTTVNVLGAGGFIVPYTFFCSPGELACTNGVASPEDLVLNGYVDITNPNVPFSQYPERGIYEREADKMIQAQDPDGKVRAYRAALNAARNQSLPGADLPLDPLISNMEPTVSYFDFLEGMTLSNVD